MGLLLPTRKNARWGNPVFSEDFSSYANSAALQAAYTTGGVSPVWTLVGGAGHLENGGSGVCWAGRSFVTDAGRNYRLRETNLKARVGIANARILIGTALNGVQMGVFQSISSSLRVPAGYFKALGTTTWITFNSNDVTLGRYAEYDDIYIDTYLGN